MRSWSIPTKHPLKHYGIKWLGAIASVAMVQCNCRLCSEEDIWA